MWGQLSFQKRVLVWDTYKCHMMDSMRREVTRGTNSDVIVISGGLTRVLQPADVSWNKPFKASYGTLYDEWMVNREKPTLEVATLELHLRSFA